jgi:hypothetical protein
MAVAFVSADVTSVDTPTTDNLTISAVTTSGTDRNLSIGSMVDLNGSAVYISSLSRGSDTFEMKAEVTGDDPSNLDTSLSVWNSTNEPQTASADLTCTLAATRIRWGFGYIVTSGVHQTTRMASPATKEGTASATGTVNVSSATGDMVVGFVSIHKTHTPTADTGTSRFSFSTSDSTGNGFTAPGTTTVASGYSWSTSEQYAYAAANLVQAAAAGGQPTMRRWGGIPGTRLSGGAHWG